MGSSKVFMSMWILAVASRIFAKYIPSLVMRTLLMLLSFLHLRYSISEQSCDTQPPLIQ